VATPSFVGAGTPIHDGGSTWPTSLTITTSDLPSGISNGQKLLVVFTFSRHTTNALSVDYSDLTDAGYVLSASAAGGVSPRSQLFIYSGEYDPADFPVTITSVADVNDLYVGDWRIDTIAYTQSDDITVTDTESNSNVAFIPTLDPTAGISTTALSTVVQIVHVAKQDVGSVLYANSMTERFRSSALTARGGGVLVLDRDEIPESTTVDYAQVGVTNPPSGWLSNAATTVQMQLIATATSGWGVGTVRRWR
jgi:hypothetical protein